MTQMNPLILVRWVDNNKGDNKKPEIRCRIVAKDLKKGNKREDLFAATPPLEAKKALMSMAATEGIGYNNKKMRRQGEKMA